MKQATSFIPMSYRIQKWLALLTACAWVGVVDAGVRVKDMGRFDGIRENVAMGYGLVVGLAGSGDSQRSVATNQTLSNLLQEFDVRVPPTSVASRNVAVVMVTVELPGFLRTGDRLDVNVSSVGDATSLAGGTLLVTPLIGVDRQQYATAQGALAVGGYKFEQAGTSRQKNHPTSASIPAGAIVERTMSPNLVSSKGSLNFILNDPDFGTATRVAEKINGNLRGVAAKAVEGGRVELIPAANQQVDVVALVAAVESLTVEPDERARVVVSERTGTIVAGGNVSLSAVTITHGDIRVAITQRYQVSQPENVFLSRSTGVNTVVVPEATVDVDESDLQAVSLQQGASIEELVKALRAIRVTTNDVIAILQGIKRAGALHAELIIQ